MYSEKKIEIIGYKNTTVPNTFYEKQQHNQKIAITFPGFSYLSNAPLLLYSKELLYEMGFDVLSVDYAYNSNHSYLQTEQEQRTAWLYEDTKAAYKKIISNKQYSEIILFGKSIGTSAILNIIQNEEIRKISKIIWMTPAIPIDRITETIVQKSFQSQFFVGTKDSYFNKEQYHVLKNMKNVNVMIYEDADHSMEIENNVMKSIENINRIVLEIRDFIK